MSETTTFTPEQQAKHCRELADLLDTDQVKNHYNHSYYTNVRDGEPDEHFFDGSDEVFNHCGTVACALGWAGVCKVGGLVLDHVGDPHLRLNGERLPIDYSADIVFGEGAYERIFSGNREADEAVSAEFNIPSSSYVEDMLDDEEALAFREAQRKVSIELLRNQAALLETQPELA